MTLDFDGLISEDLLDIYQNGIDATINRFGHVCELIYPPKTVTCSTCNGDPIGKKSSSFALHGGAVPNFAAGGGTCPTCNGKGVKQVQVTEDITLKVYWSPKEFLSLGVKIESPATSVQTMGYMVDLPKVKQANEIILVKNMRPYVEWKCKKLGEAVPHGFRQKRYFIQFWQRV